MDTTYHKIDTLYERDPKTFKLLPQLVLKNPVYGMIKTWQWTEKVDGTNIRITYTPGADKLTIGGRTDNAQIHADLYRWITEHITLEKMQSVFQAATEPVVLYGEGFGAGIQKVGVKYGPTKKFILFDVRVGTWWLSQDNVNNIADKLGIQVVPYFGEHTLEHATELVRNGLHSVVEGADPTFISEGLVGRPAHTLFDSRGKRLIVKLKTIDFATAEVK